MQLTPSPVAHQVRPTPAIDAQVPDALSTATFALG